MLSSGGEGNLQRCHLNDSKPNSSICYTVPYRPNLPFLISGIRARQSARMSEIKNGSLGLYVAEHSKCSRMTKLGFKVLR